MNIRDSAFNHLRSLNDYILIYSKKSLYTDYLMSQQKRNDCIIALLRNSENLDETHDCEQVQAIILILSNDHEDDEKKNIQVIEKNYKKLMGIFKDQYSMIEKVQQLIVNVEHQQAQNMTNLFSTFNPNERSLKDLRSEWVTFLWCHVFKSKQNDFILTYKYSKLF